MTQQAKILLHAPTAAALARARSNLNNLRQRQRAPEVRIVINAEAVAAALDNADAAADAQTHVCGNTLRKIGRSAPPPFQVIEDGAILAIAQWQAEGWTYIRA